MEMWLSWSTLNIYFHKLKFHCFSPISTHVPKDKHHTQYSPHLVHIQQNKSKQSLDKLPFDGSLKVDGASVRKMFEFLESCSPEKVNDDTSKLVTQDVVCPLACEEIVEYVATGTPSSKEKNKKKVA